MSGFLSARLEMMQWQYKVTFLVNGWWADTCIAFELHNAKQEEIASSKQSARLLPTLSRQ